MLIAKVSPRSAISRSRSSASVMSGVFDRLEQQVGLRFDPAAAHDLADARRLDRRLAGRAGLVLQQPPDPACMNLSCQRQTQVFDLPVAAMMAFVPKPSAVRTTIHARQTCFWGVLPSATMISRRRRSAAETEMEIPLRMPQ